ncbi:MAG TPA: putative peptidoglycan glycosyltransferase FtsW [Alphaproteobacteria bacterium]|nr:putative peptidoglycan glycosyltransferase FtsW [Alphaproteobacteria bacterium]
MPIARSDRSVLGRWWWTVDHWTLACIGVLLVLGVFLIQAASPAGALHLGQGGFYFVERHLIQLAIGVMIMIGLSLLTPAQIRVAALILFIISFALVIVTIYFGVEVKGARRWLHLPGMSVQPSEFLKPAFIVMCARLFSRKYETPNFPGQWLAAGLYLMVIAALLSQPDMGMTVLISTVFAAQLLLSGAPLIVIGGLFVIGVGGIGLGYILLPHVASRINRFINPDSGDTYQITRSLEAFHNGGWFGVGPGEGQVKMSLPDAHTDFIFPVAGEEFGLIACLFIVLLFAFIVLRGFWRLSKESNFFVFLAVAGLLIEFGLQAVINMGSALHLLPTKGMTLPFISYGGSSLLALSISAGMLLALTRKRAGADR